MLPLPRLRKTPALNSKARTSHDTSPAYWDQPIKQRRSALGWMNPVFVTSPLKTSSKTIKWRVRGSSMGAQTYCWLKPSSIRSIVKLHSLRFNRELSRRKLKLPIMVSGTITDASGRTLSGQTPEAFWASIRHANLASIGLNCALGAEDAPSHSSLANRSQTLVSAHPNAGLPNEPRRTGRG